MIIPRNTDNNHNHERELNDWVKGLHDKDVVEMELYKRSKQHKILTVRVKLRGGSSYRIQRTSINSSFIDTIEVTTPSDFDSRPTIVVTFKSPPNLDTILPICRSIPDKLDDTYFGLTVMLNTVRHAFTGSYKAGSTASGSLSEARTQPSLDELWKDAYSLILRHEHELWEESLHENTKNLIQERIYEETFQALLNKEYLKEEERPIAYSAMARAVTLLSKDDCAEPPPQDVAWDNSWMEAGHSLSTKIPEFPFIRDIALALSSAGKNARGISPQIDGRNLPHRHLLKDFLFGKTLVHFQSMGHGYHQSTTNLQCPQSETPASNSTKCDCYVWASDWQIAASMAWTDSWVEAFDEGKKMAKEVLKRGIPDSPTPGYQSNAPPRSSNHDPAVDAIIKSLAWMRRKLNEKHETSGADGSIIGEWQYPALKAHVQQRARKSLGTKNTGKSRFTQAYNTAASSLKVEAYANEAWKHAYQTIGNQGGASSLVQLEWQKFKSSSIFNRLLGQWRTGNRWKKGFENSLEEAWLGLWKEAWLAAWKEAYKLAESKGIELGVSIELANPANLDNQAGRTNQANEISLRRHRIVADLEKMNSYKHFREGIRSQEPNDALKFIRLLAKDLNQVANFSKRILHNSHRTCFTIRVLVPNKDQDLDDLSRIRLRPPVLQELSYLELRKFIMSEYFRNKPRETHDAFQICVSKSWKTYSGLRPSSI